MNVPCAYCVGLSSLYYLWAIFSMADNTGTAANRYFLGLKMCFAGHFSIFLRSAVHKVKQRKSLLMMEDNGGRRELQCHSKIKCLSKCTITK